MALSYGDVQWMSAGSGIIHQEMPKGDARGAMYGFQLWANLPAANKMSEPRYRGIPSGDIPVVTDRDGAIVRVVAGLVGEVVGPVRDVVTQPEYLDVTVPAGKTFTHRTRREHTVFAYVFEGSGVFADDGAAAPGAPVASVQSAARPPQCPNRTALFVGAALLLAGLWSTRRAARRG